MKKPIASAAAAAAILAVVVSGCTSPCHPVDSTPTAETPIPPRLGVLRLEYAPILKWGEGRPQTHVDCSSVFPPFGGWMQGSGIWAYPASGMEDGIVDDPRVSRHCYEWGCGGFHGEVLERELSSSSRSLYRFFDTSGEEWIVVDLRLWLSWEDQILPVLHPEMQ